MFCVSVTLNMCIYTYLQILFHLIYIFVMILLAKVLKCSCFDSFTVNTDEDDVTTY